MLEDEKQYAELCKEFVKVLEEGNKVLDDADKSLEQAFGVLSREIKLELALKLVEYADKFANATFITRWYWMRKMKKFVKGINVIKEL